MTTTFRTALLGRKSRFCALATAALVFAPGSTVPALADHVPANAPVQSGFAPQAPSPGPSVGGTAQDGQTLTASLGTWTLGVTLSHRWIRCEANGTGCVFLHADNSNTYVLVPADVGKTIKLRVRGTRTTPDGWREADSAPTAVVQAATPTIEAYPGNTGKAAVGETLTATSARYSYATPPFSEDQYQWERCEPPEFTTCKEIGGATHLKHILTEADLGKQVRMRERATYGPDDRTVDARSPNSATVVAAGATPPSGPPAAAKLLDPFPVIAIGGVLTSSGANLSLLRVRGPRGATVSVRCLGPVCPTRTVRRRIGARLTVRIRPLERKTAFGTRLVFRITQPGMIGKYTRLRIRAGQRPTRVDGCLQPGATRPSPCPQS